MSEHEPQINLSVGNNEFELRRENATLYTYLAHAAFAHIFIEDHSDERTKTGTFIPRELIGEENFDIVALAMIENFYPAHINALEVSDGDAEIITRILSGGVEDEVPEDWLK